VLRAVPPGNYVVRQDSVWVVSGHDPRSYDSRYWGPLPVNAITGRAVPVLIGAAG
jgi:type IV secretory pathway protease TraF